MNLWLAGVILWCIVFLMFLVGIVWFFISGCESTAALTLMAISCVLLDVMAVLLNLT